MAFNMTEVAGAQMQGAPASGIVEIAEHLRRSSVLIGDGPGGRGGSGVIWEDRREQEPYHHQRARRQRSASACDAPRRADFRGSRRQLGQSA